MKVVITHAYYISEDEKESKVMKPYPPLGIGYISGYLNAQKIANKLIDSTFETQEDHRAQIVSLQPRVLGIYTNLVTKLQVLQLIRFCKSHPKLQDTKIILGGPDLRYNQKNYLDQGADFLVLGEGEETFAELSSWITDDQQELNTLKEIPGLAFLNENGEVHQTDTRKHIKDLEELTEPNRAAYPLGKYIETWKKYHGYSALNISSQRGCPYTCRWCSTAVYGQSYRRRPAHLVVQEMKHIQESYHPDRLWFVDDVFTVSHKWLKSLQEELNKASIRVPFECITRAERMNDEMIALMKDIGCVKIWIGAESGSQKILDAMDRKVDAEKVIEVIQKCNAAGIETGTFIMVGYPGENREDIEATVNHLKRSNPTSFTSTIAYPIKGTGLYAETEDKFVEKLDWASTTDRDIDFTREKPRKYYVYALKYINNEFAFSKARKESKSLWTQMKLKGKSIAARVLMGVVR